MGLCENAILPKQFEFFLEKRRTLCFIQPPKTKPEKREG
jgi:hypothetical protein